MHSEGSLTHMTVGFVGSSASLKLYTPLESWALRAKLRQEAVIQPEGLIGGKPPWVVVGATRPQLAAALVLLALVLLALALLSLLALLGAEAVHDYGTIAHTCAAEVAGRKASDESRVDDHEQEDHHVVQELAGGPDEIKKEHLNVDEMREIGKRLLLAGRGDGGWKCLCLCRLEKAKMA
ncbi:hypothetical protein F5Y13DRAFT_203142 [Hypoxylon sp. FL1857]|nr:hypothetical protein F5Y13DRAFT_203142 [Hypoxylon sp. FL1857]